MPVNSSLDAITSSYQSNDTKKADKEDALGRDAFLTMLVAQLQNQDPLNPMDGTDFSAQLAQFSQLEQLMNLNESMETMSSSFESDSEKDLVGYMGKQVTGEVNSMEVSEGQVSGGFFNLPGPADIVVEVMDSSGSPVKTLQLGTKEGGSHLVSWDGTDNGGNAVDDGTYTYNVLANTGSGFGKVPNSVTGVVDGIAYSNDKPYLMVQGILVDPDQLSSVIDIENDLAPVDSAMDYLGKTVSSNQPILEVKDGVVQGDDLAFELDRNEGAVIKIYDPFDNLIRTINLDESSVNPGKNTVGWDAVGNDGYQAGDGLYYYRVETPSGAAKTRVSEEVAGIRNTNGVQYLVLQDTGRLVSISSITAVNK